MRRADGNYVAFESSNYDPNAGTFINADVYLFDRTNQMLANISASLSVNGEEHLTVGALAARRSPETGATLFSVASFATSLLDHFTCVHLILTEDAKLSFLGQNLWREGN